MSSVLYSQLVSDGKPGNESDCASLGDHRDGVRGCSVADEHGGGGILNCSRQQFPSIVVKMGVVLLRPIWGLDHT